MINNRQLIFGSSYIKPKETHVFNFTADAVGATTPGRRTSIQKKFDGNEDALGFAQTAGGDLLLVADSHYGSLAADLAVTHCEDVLNEAGQWQADPQRGLFAAHLALDRLIATKKLERGAHPGCSTTLISVLVRAGEAWFCATGDSSLYLLRRQSLTLLNEQHANLFLGELQPRLSRLLNYLEGSEMYTPPGPAAQLEALLQLCRMQEMVRERRMDRQTLSDLLLALERILGFSTTFTVDELLEPWHPLHVALGKNLPYRGHVVLEPGDLLLLASDGIDEEASGCHLEEVAAVLGDAASLLATRAQNLLTRCLSKSGGKDNLSFVLARY